MSSFSSDWLYCFILQTCANYLSVTFLCLIVPLLAKVWQFPMKLNKMVSILTRFERYYEFKTPLVWKNIIFLTLGYILAIYGITLLPTAKIATILWVVFNVYASGTAITIGPHRLWTHRTYKAKLPLRIFLMLVFVLSGQYSIVQWTRDHRTHHKYTDTDADPHNASRGLFFSHCGWFMMKRHPEVKEKGKTIDLSDLWQDPVIRFHQKYFLLLVMVVHVIFPSAISYYVIGDTLKNSIFICFFTRYLLSLNIVWCLNSFSHYWGFKPYNKNIKATNNAILAFCIAGEGWHNFHHTFPWDYRIGELGQRYQYGTNLIDMFAYFGLAYDLKSASPELIQKVSAKQNLPQNYEAPETGFTEKVETNKKE